ncbi:MAG: phosphoribosyltransferase family protein [Dehalococcoidales bacterium]
MNLTEPEVIFEDRHEAGRKLAAVMEDYKGKQVVVLAIPNGGIPVGIELAAALNAELGVVVCRKIPIPMAPEGSLGAVAEDGTVYLNEAAVKRIGLSREQINYEASKVRVDVKQRSMLYQANRLPIRVNERVVIVVDDGLASGITMTAAVESVRGRRAREIVVAVPVASATAVNKLERVADKVFTCTTNYRPKFYIADYYRHWFDIGDDEVLRYLEQWRTRRQPKFGTAS